MPVILLLLAMSALAFACSSTKTTDSGIAKPAQVRDMFDGGPAASGGLDAGGTSADSKSAGGECSDFWAMLEIDANWAEFFPSIEALANGSDVIAFGRFSSVTQGSVVQGDAPEDRYNEIVLGMDPSAEIIAGNIAPGELELTIVPGTARTTAETLAACIPSARVLVFARKRADSLRLHRPVNGNALWAPTPRGAVDTPLNPFPPSEGLFAEETANFESLDEMVEAVREQVTQP